MNPGSPDYDWNYAAEKIAGRDYLKLAIWQRQDLDGYGLFTHADRHPRDDGLRLLDPHASGTTIGASTT